MPTLDLYTSLYEQPPSCFAYDMRKICIFKRFQINNPFVLSDV